MRDVLKTLLMKIHSSGFINYYQKQAQELENDSHIVGPHVVPNKVLFKVITRHLGCDTLLYIVNVGVFDASSSQETL